MIQEIHDLQLDPEQALKKYAVEYCNYAINNPTIYKTVMGMKSEVCNHDQLTLKY